MTALIRRTEPWSTQPGWGIVVDLTPQELLTTRHLRLVRKLVVAALLAVFLLGVGGYVLAVRQRSSAEDDLANAQLTTTQLQKKVHEYSTVTQIQGTVTQVKSQIAGLMHGDVALDALLDRLGADLTAGMTISHINVTISLAGVNGTQSGTSATTATATGHPAIGNVTMSGAALRFVDVSAYVDRVARIAGVVDVVPTSNAKGDKGVEYNVKLGLDDRLLSHRFDVTKGGN